MAVPQRNKKEKPTFTPGSLVILMVSVISIGLLGGALVILVQKGRKPAPPPSESQAPQRAIPSIKPEKVEQIPVQKITKMESEKPTPPPSPTAPPPPVPTPVPVSKAEPAKTGPGEARRPLRGVSKSRVPKKQVRGAVKRFGQEGAAEEKSASAATELKGVAPAFTIQVGSYTDEEKAKKLGDQLKEKGFDAYVQTGTVRTKTYYRVRVGEFDTREKAEIIAKRLHEKGASPPFVTRYQK